MSLIYVCTIKQKKPCIRLLTDTRLQVPWNGVEPSRPLGHTPLKRARLPIPPPGQKYNLTKFSNHYFRWCRTISSRQLSGHTPLKRARLPIPPPGQKYNLTKFSNHYFRWYRTISPQQLSGQTPSIPSAFEISILPVFFEAFFHIYTSVKKRA